MIAVRPPINEELSLQWLLDSLDKDVNEAKAVSSDLCRPDRELFMWFPDFSWNKGRGHPLVTEQSGAVHPFCGGFPGPFVL